MCSKSMAIQSMSILRITGVCACETGESFYSVSKNEKKYDFETGSLHILFAAYIINIVGQFQKIKKIKLLKVGGIYENHYKRKVS